MTRRLYYLAHKFLGHKGAGLNPMKVLKGLEESDDKILRAFLRSKHKIDFSQYNEKIN
jgi:hypothetical protein